MGAKGTLKKVRIGDWAIIQTPNGSRVACHLVELSADGAYLEVPSGFDVKRGELIYELDGKSESLRLSFRVSKAKYWKNFSALGSGNLRGIEIEFDKNASKQLHLISRSNHRLASL